MSLYVYLNIKVDTGGDELHSLELYESTITHNLGAMAESVGLYQHLWRPEEMGISKARHLIEPLRDGIKKLEDDSRSAKGHNPPNGWGNYDDLLNFCRRYLIACLENPKAAVEVCR
jgi:hypothetical protein